MHVCACMCARMCMSTCVCVHVNVCDRDGERDRREQLAGLGRAWLPRKDLTYTFISPRQPGTFPDSGNDYSVVSMLIFGKIPEQMMETDDL